MSAVMEQIEDRNRLVEFDEFESKLIEFKDKYDGVVYDLTIPDQDKQARSDRFAIGKIVSALDSKHKELKAPLKAKVDLIDGRRKEIKDQLLDVQDKIKSQIDAHEEALVRHAQKLQNMVDEINLLGVFTWDTTGAPFVPDSKEISRRLNIMAMIDVDDSLEDRKPDAALAQMEVAKKLNILLIETIKSEQEAAELTQLRVEKESRERAEREEQIRQEAADKATREAEAAADKAIAEAEKRERAAVERAAQEKLESELAIKRAAESAREKAKLEQAQKEAKEKAWHDKAEAKKEKLAHRNKIQKKAISSLVLAGVEKSKAAELVTLIDEGQIQNISIIY